MGVLPKLGGASRHPTAGLVLGQLQAAETTLGVLEREHESAALQSLDGTKESAAELAAVADRLREARAKADLLRVAHRAAAAREAEADRARVVALRRTQIRSVRMHLAAAEKSADLFREGIEKAVQGYRTMHASVMAAKGACPAGISWPACGIDDPRQLAEREMWRVGGDPSIDASLSLPGGRPHDERYRHQPESLPSLVEEIQSATAHVLNELNRRAGTEN